jgi:acetylornithine deacetylase/succinyl-diaminopimelate desuccinylase-like protein
VKTITRDAKGNLLPQYCNFRLTRRLPDGNLAVEGNYHFSVWEAASDAVFFNKGIADVVSVEFRGKSIREDTYNYDTDSIVPAWRNVIEAYRELYGECYDAAGR